MALVTVDFSLFLKGAEEQKQNAAEKIVESFRRCGFVKLVNHGIPLATIKKMEEWVDGNPLFRKWREANLACEYRRIEPSSYSMRVKNPR